jgi:hypothetical protein
MLIYKFRYSLFAILVFTCVGFAGEKDTDTDDLKLLQQQVNQLQQQMNEENERHRAEMKLLREEIELLKQTKESPAKESSPQIVVTEPNTPLETVAGSEAKPLSQISQSFNPDISAIGDVLFHAGRNEENRRQDQFQFRELELALGSAVDPYGRADFFIGIEEEDGEWHPDVEEGYFTLNMLPYDLKARAGKFYSAIGKANQTHTHAMPWVDKPAVIKNFFGEEGMSEAGAEVSWLVPNPWDNYTELIFQVQDDGNEASFAGEHSNDLMYVAHLKNFFDINNDSSVELGGSFATGSNAATDGGHRTNLEGLDLTYKWRPAQQGLYKSLTWMNEMLFSQKEQGADDTVNAHGFYSSLEYQFCRRWSVFGRYDYSQFPDDSKSYEDAYSTGLTFRQSEYCFWRLQYEHTEPRGDSTTEEGRDELFVQLDFGIGPHRAHQY